MERIAERERDMITPIKALKISDILERKEDLLIGVDDLKHMAKNERADAIRELKQRFRSEYEEMMELEMEDCINWADWLDATAEQIIADREG